MPKLRTARFVLVWTGIAIHLLTIYVAYRLGGWLEAGLSLLFPFAAQVYWIVDIWRETGGFWHFLTLICLAYIAAWLIAALIRRPAKRRYQ
jgi:hypothetical protein